MYYEFQFGKHLVFVRPINFDNLDVFEVFISDVKNRVRYRAQLRFSQGLTRPVLRKLSAVYDSMDKVSVPDYIAAFYSFVVATGLDVMNRYKKDGCLLSTLSFKDAFRIRRPKYRISSVFPVDYFIYETKEKFPPLDSFEYHNKNVKFLNY